MMFISSSAFSIASSRPSSKSAPLMKTISASARAARSLGTGWKECGSAPTGMVDVTSAASPVTLRTTSAKMLCEATICRRSSWACAPGNTRNNNKNTTVKCLRIEYLQSATVRIGIGMETKEQCFSEVIPEPSHVALRLRIASVLIDTKSHLRLQVHNRDSMIS